MGERVVIQDSGSWSRAVFGLPGGGKMADSQDCFLFYYKKVDLRNENFSISALFEVTDASKVDSQSSYGIAAVDTVAAPGPDSRHRNMALVGRFRTLDGRNYGQGLRVVGGYTDRNALPGDGRRKMDPTRLFPTQNPMDAIKAGDTHRLKLVKSDFGLVAFLNTESGEEKIEFPGCDFLLHQDKRYAYVGFAVAGDVGLRIGDVRFETSPGKSSKTPSDAIGRYVPDYPFFRDLLPEPVSPVGEKICDSIVRVSPGNGPAGLSEAILKAGPGCEIVLADGVYSDGPYYIPAYCSGESGRPVTIRAEHKGAAVIDGSCIVPKLPAVILRADHWKLEDLVIKCAPSSGLFICGSDNEVIRCEACGNGDTGVLICSFPGTSKEEWPHRNRVESCLSHHNVDTARCNADGFGAKLSVGQGNAFRLCKAFHNVDDGFDLYTKSTLGPIGPVTLENCEAAYNGLNSSRGGSSGRVNPGTGFKLGGERQKVRHLVRECFAHDNAGPGFDVNSNTAPRLAGCKAYGNNPDFVLPSAYRRTGLLKKLAGKFRRLGTL